MELKSEVVRKTDLLSASVGDEVVILSTQNGMYYGMQSVGERIWSILEMPTRVVDLRDQIMEEFDVEQAICQRDIFAFLKQLEGEGLIDIR